MFSSKSWLLNGSLLLALASIGPAMTAGPGQGSDRIEPVAAVWDGAFGAQYLEGRSLLLVDETVSPSTVALRAFQRDEQGALIFVGDALFTEVARFPVVDAAAVSAGVFFGPEGFAMPAVADVGVDALTELVELDLLDATEDLDLAIRMAARYAATLRDVPLVEAARTEEQCIRAAAQAMARQVSAINTKYARDKARLDHLARTRQITPSDYDDQLDELDRQRAVALRVVDRVYQRRVAECGRISSDSTAMTREQCIRDAARSKARLVSSINTRYALEKARLERELRRRRITAREYWERLEELQRQRDNALRVVETNYQRRLAACERLP